MKVITFNQIKALNISPATCVDWVTESFKLKYESELPAKISVHPYDNVFFTTMPCLLPAPINKFGVKEVSRYPERNPSLSSDILLYDSTSGNLLAMMDGDWITAMRTGAVATLAIKKLRNSCAKEYGFIGLGNTARATLLCLLCSSPDDHFHVKLLRYKDQAELFMERFSSFPNLSFTIVESAEQLVRDTDVIVSCVTSADDLIVEDTSLFKEGALVVPIHTRGFQNCDLCFDKVFADDTDHVKGFRYFSQFKKFEEFSRVLLETSPGRENDKERILSYNIGLGLHDIFFANKVYEMVGIAFSNIKLEKVTDKFWV